MFYSRTITLLTLLISIVLSFSYTSVYANEDQDQLDVKNRVLNLQQSDVGLPGGVAEQKGRVGTLLARLFDSDGKIKRIFLDKIFAGISDGELLRYDAGSNGFIATLIDLADLAGNSVDSSKVVNNSLTASDLAPNAVGNSELTDTPVVTTLGVYGGVGNGVKFWNSNSYKIHMGNTAEYQYGPVSGYSIKNNMNNDSSRGWTWGVSGLTPVVAFNTEGNAQFAGTVSGVTPTADEHLATKEYVDTEVSTAGGWTKTGSDIYRNGGKVGIGTSGPIIEDFEVHGDAMLIRNTSAQLFFDQTFQNNTWDDDYLIETWGDGLIFFEGTYDPSYTTGTPSRMKNWVWSNGGEYVAGGDEVMRIVNGRVGIQVDSGNVNYTLHVNGTAGKSGGGSWSNSSDSRLKDIQGDYEYGLDEIVGLEPIRFNYKEGNARGLATTTNEVGFIAQDVARLIPDAVNEGEDGYLDFNMHSINVALVNAVKELSEKNDALEKDVEELKALLQ